MDEYLIHYESYLYTEQSQEAAYDVQSPSSFDSSIFNSISNAVCLASFIKMIYGTGFIGIQSGTLGTPFLQLFPADITKMGQQIIQTNVLLFTLSTS